MLRSFLPLFLLAAVGCPQTPEGENDPTGGGWPLDADGDGVAAAKDCDDDDASVFPGQPESCDGLDNDCNGEVDEGVALTLYPDSDGDGHFASANPIAACDTALGSETPGDDCDDANAEMFPGNAEVCDLVDNDCNGFGDDALANWYQMSSDYDGDGAPESAYYSHFTAENYTDVVKYDYDGNGAWEYAEWRTLDEWGNPIEADYDDDSDGLADYIVYRNYDQHGWWNYEARDVDADGSIDEEDTFAQVLDEAGHVLLEEADYYTDGTIDYIHSFAWDSLGNMTEWNRDDDADGKLDSIYTYSFDANGFQTYAGYDYDADDTDEYSSSYTWDANGYLLAYSSDSNGDGISDYSMTLAYDAAGRVIEQVSDYDGDGAPDYVERLAYDDATGTFAGGIDADGDGVEETVYEGDYNADGQITRMVRDNDGDGFWDWVQRVDIDPLAYVYRTDFNYDGVVDTIYTMTLDELGRSTGTCSDEHADGSCDSSSTTVFGCED